MSIATPNKSRSAFSRFAAAMAAAAVIAFSGAQSAISSIAGLWQNRGTPQRRHRARPGVTAATLRTIPADPHRKNKAASEFNQSLRSAHNVPGRKSRIKRRLKAERAETAAASWYAHRPRFCTSTFLNRLAALRRRAAVLRRRVG